MLKSIYNGQTDQGSGKYIKNNKSVPQDEDLLHLLTSEPQYFISDHSIQYSIVSLQATRKKNSVGNENFFTLLEINAMKA